MELGENNLETELDQLKAYWRQADVDNKLIEQKIEEIIMQILEAIKEMHKCNPYIKKHFFKLPLFS
jgi:vacuolar-type H+-ATPase subunit D/Vma8